MADPGCAFPANPLTSSSTHTNSAASVVDAARISWTSASKCGLARPVCEQHSNNGKPPSRLQTPHHGHYDSCKPYHLTVVCTYMNHMNHPPHFPLLLALLLTQLPLASTQCSADQGWLPLLQCDVETDNNDFLTIYNDGVWSYTSDGNPPFGLCGGTATDGFSFQCMDQMNAFPTWASPAAPLTDWKVEVISGIAPRCPLVGAGSNPDQTVSLVECGDSYIKVQFNDSGSCGTSGRIAFTIRISYFDNLPFDIIQQPSGTTATAGSPMQLEVTTTAINPTYQWRHNRQPIPGENASTLQFPSLQASDCGDYDVLVSTATGSLLSDPAPVRVITTDLQLYIEPLFGQFILLYWQPEPCAASYSILARPTLAEPGTLLTTPIQFDPSSGSEYSIIMAQGDAEFYSLEINF
jgi:hypothetical protein